MPGTLIGQTRVTGSGFTTLNYQGQPIAWLTDFQDRGQAALGGTNPGGGVDAIYTLGANTVQDFATSRVLEYGTLAFSIQELWNAPAWQQIQGLAGTNNIVDVFQAMAAINNPITAQSIIKPPGSTTWRGWAFNNCLVTGIGDGEHIAIGGMAFTRGMTLVYSEKTPLSMTGPAVY